ncbi:FAD:protein FMN transferase [bacterium]|nr:FAD:protein FMN transferase [bacterium]
MLPTEPAQSWKNRHKGRSHQCGGEVMAFGTRTWQVGIGNPRAPGLLAVIPLKARAVATSGDYERFFVHEGRCYCHTLDPATGYPSQILMSASVIAGNCTLANAWAVALFIRGHEMLGPVIDKLGMEWITVGKKGIIRASTALKKHISLKS